MSTIGTQQSAVDPLAAIARTSPNPTTAYRVLELILWALGYTPDQLPSDFALSTDLVNMGADQLSIDDILVELGHEFSFDDLSETESKINRRTAEEFIALVVRESSCEGR